MFDELVNALRNDPIMTRNTEDGSPVYIWSDGDLILCESELVIDLIADLLDGAGYIVATGYYDPDEDRQSGTENEYTGNWYVTIN